MKIEHPYAPEIEWRFAVSRRFTSPYVERLYREYVYPVIFDEGMVMECYYAAETPESDNYWVNRMNLILELSDIHILVDIDPSTFTTYEINRARRASRVQMRTTLVRNFGDRIANYHKLLGPPEVLIVKESDQPQEWSSSRRVVTIYLPKSARLEDFQQELRKQINEVKSLKRNDMLRRAEWSERWTPTVLRLLGNDVPLAPPAQRKDWLMVYQSIARLLLLGKSIEEISAAIQPALTLPVEKLAAAIDDAGHIHDDLAPVTHAEFDFRQVPNFDDDEEMFRHSNSASLGVEPRALIDAQVAFDLETKQEELNSPRPARDLFRVYRTYYSEYIPKLLWEFMSIDSSDNRFVAAAVKTVVSFMALKRTVEAKAFRSRLKKARP